MLGGGLSQGGGPKVTAEKKGVGGILLSDRTAGIGWSQVEEEEWAIPSLEAPVRGEF